MYFDRITTIVAIGAYSTASCAAFTPNTPVPKTQLKTTTSLNGLFDNWGAGGSGKDRLDEEVGGYWVQVNFQLMAQG